MQVKLSNNQTYEFPDDATPEEVQRFDLQQQMQVERTVPELDWFSKRLMPSGGTVRATAPLVGAEQEAIALPGQMARTLATASEYSPPFREPGLRWITPEERTMESQRQNRSTAQHIQAIKESPAFKFGEAQEARAQKIAPLNRAEREEFLVNAAQGAVGMAPIIASGPFAPATIGIQSFSEHLIHDYDQAKEAGKSDDEAASTAMNKALLSGGLQGAVFAFLPKPLRKLADKYLVDKFAATALAKPLSEFLVRRGAQAGETGTLMAASHAVEQPIEGRSPIEGLPTAFASGALLGAATPRGPSEAQQEMLGPPARPFFPIPEIPEKQNIPVQASARVVPSQPFVPPEPGPIGRIPDIRNTQARRRVTLGLPNENQNQTTSPLPVQQGQPVERPAEEQIGVGVAQPQDQADKPPEAQAPSQPLLDNLRPAIRKIDGSILVGDKGEVHQDIIDEHKLKAKDVDRRIFVDVLQPDVELSREQVAALGVPARDIGQTPAGPTERAHAPELAEAQQPSSETAKPSGITILAGREPRPVASKEIAARPELMQFKHIEDSTTGENAEEKLTGKWDPYKAGPLLLWEPTDPAKYGLTGDQKYIVANGHHRFAFGQRDGVENYSAQVLRESDGFSAEDARRKAAEVNIADGKGTIYDQVKYLRNERTTRSPDEEVGERARIGARGGKAAAIAFDASDDVYSSFINEKISPDQAEAISVAAPKDPLFQKIGLKQALKGRRPIEIENDIKASMVNTAYVKSDQLSLWGDDDVNIKQAELLSDFVTNKQKELNKRIQTISGASRNPEIAKQEGIDIHDPDAVKNRLVELNQQKIRMQGWSQSPTMISELKREFESKQKGEKPPLTLEPPESVEDQKARLAQEEAARQAQAAKDAAAKQSAAPLLGGTGDLGQGDLLGGGQDLFAPPPPKPTEPFGSKNKIVTTERAEELKKRIKDKLMGGAGQIPKERRGEAGSVIKIDPTVFADAVQLGAYYIEGGYHRFSDWSAKMLEDFGEAIKDHLKSIYETARVTIEAPTSREFGGEGAGGRRPGLQPGLRPPAERIVTAREPFTKTADESVIPPSLVPHLDEHQRQGVAHAIRSFGTRQGFLLADGTGAGKTRQAISVASHFAGQGKKVIIVTKSETIKQDWAKKTFGGSYAFDSNAMGVRVRLSRDGQANPGEIVITTYENLKDVERHTDANTVLIYDESHALKNDSQRAKFGVRAAGKAARVMFMSATPADKPEHIYYLAPIGVMEGKTTQQQLRDLGMTLVTVDKMVKVGERWQKQKVTFWAEDQRVSDAERHERFSALFDRLTDKGAVLKREISMDGVHVQVLKVALPPEAHETMGDILKFFDANDIEDLKGMRKAIVLGHQRRQQEPYKIAPTVMLAKRELDAGRQVVIFVSRVNVSEVGKWVTTVGIGGERERFREVLMSSEGTAKSLRDALHEAGIHDIAEIHGNSDQNSLEAMADFQAGRKRAVIATIESGGTGINLDDIVGNAPRSMIVVTAPFDAVGNVQAAGRIWRLKTLSGSSVYYLFGDTAVDDWNSDIIGTKMSMLGAVVEGQVRRLNMSDPELVGTDDFHSQVRRTAEPTATEPTGKAPVLEWKPFTTKAGNQKFVAPATKEFWDWYNANGKGNNPLGLRPSKWEGQWNVWTDKIPNEPTPGLTPSQSATITEAEAQTFRQKAENIAAKLEELKAPGPETGALQVFGLTGAIWNQAVSIVQASIRAGGSIADAIEKAIQFIKDNFKGEWDEKGARESLAKPETGKVPTQVAGEKIGELRDVEHIAPIREQIKTRLFDGDAQLTPENTDKAIMLVRSASDPATKLETTKLIARDIKGDMTMGLLQSELWTYANRLVIAGDDTLMREMVKNYAAFSHTIGGEGPTAIGRMLRSLLELSKHPSWRNAVSIANEIEVAAGRKLGVGAEALNKIIDVLKGVRPEEQDFKEKPDLKLPPSTTKAEEERALQEELSQEEKRNEAVAYSIMDTMEKAAPHGATWLKPDVDPNIIRKIVQKYLRPTPEQQRAIVENSFTAAMVRELRAAGVTPQTAGRLAKVVYERVVTNWSSARERAVVRASKSRSLSSLVEAIQTTPLLTQKTPGWRVEAATNWFLSRGLSREQAAAAAQRFAPQFEAALQNAAERVATPLLDRAKTGPRTLAEFVQIVRSGILDPNFNLSEEYAKRAGWKPPTQEQLARIAALELRLSDPKLSLPEKSALAEQMMGEYRHMRLPPSILRTVASNYVATNLMGIATQTIHAFGPGVFMLTDRVLGSMAHPTDFMSLWKSLGEAYKGFLSQQKFVLTKDAAFSVEHELAGAHNELKRVWEVAQQDIHSGNPARASAGYVKALFGAQQFVMRFLGSWFHANFMAVREAQLAFYGKMAFKDAGLGAVEINALSESVSNLKNAAYQDAIESGLDENTARVRADAVAADQLVQFIENKTSPSVAAMVERSAELDAWSTIGRRQPKLEEEGGLLSTTIINPLMRVASKLRSGPALEPAIGVFLFGYMSVPYRTARYYAWNSPYGLLRIGIYNLQKSRGWEPWYQQALGTELQYRNRLHKAIAASVAQALLLGAFGFVVQKTSDPDAAKKGGIFFMGTGPRNKGERDALDKMKFQENAINIFLPGHTLPIHIPLTRVGEPLANLFWPLVAADDKSWRKREVEVQGKPFEESVGVTAWRAIGAYASLLSQHGPLQQLSHITRAGGGPGVTKALTTEAASVLASATQPFLGLQRNISNLIIGPADQSSLESAAAAAFPILGIFGDKFRRGQINRFGDLLYDQTWEGKIQRFGFPMTFSVANTNQNKELYTTLVEKGVAPAPLLRSHVESVYRPMSDSEWQQFGQKSGAELKKTVLDNLDGLKEMEPEQVKKFLNRAATVADSQTALELGLERSKPKAVAVSGGGGRAPVSEPALKGPTAAGIGRARGFSARRVSLGGGLRPRGLRPARGLGSRLKGSRSGTRRVRLGTSRVKRLRLPRRRVSLYA